MCEAELKPHLLKLGGDRLLHSPQHSHPKRPAQCPLLPRLSGPNGQCIVTLSAQLLVILMPIKARALLFPVVLCTNSVVQFSSLLPQQNFKGW